MNTHTTKSLPSFYILRQNFKKIIFYSLLAILVYFLFEAGGVGEERHRLIQGIWNLGHIVLFMLLGMACLNTALLNKRSLVFKISIVTLASLILGTATEAIQLLVQREFSIDDIANDLIGAYLALLIQSITDKMKTTTTRFGASMLAILFLSIGFRDFIPTVMDEMALYEDFPVLASFESDAEIDRWEFIDARAVRDEQSSISGQYSLKVEYLPAIYPSISLLHLKSDWRGYEQLSLSIYSINQQNIPFEIKVHDKYHSRSRGGYNDRFNKNITLKQGWNFIAIPLAEIAASPKGRFMDMSEINRISLFTHKLLKPTTLYIDDIRLM
jgi:VanZ family protein